MSEKLNFHRVDKIWAHLKKNKVIKINCYRGNYKLGGVYKECWHVFGFFWPSSPYIVIFYLINVWTIYPPLLVNVVCKWPLNLSKFEPRNLTIVFFFSLSVQLTFCHTSEVFLDFVLDSVPCLAWSACIFSPWDLAWMFAWIEMNLMYLEDYLTTINSNAQSFCLSNVKIRIPLRIKINTTRGWTEKKYTGPNF